MSLLFFFFFFFFSSRRRHTRLVSDWSSDVCSSDLNLINPDALGAEETRHLRYNRTATAVTDQMDRQLRERPAKIGRASCRERVYISVVAGSLKKKKEKSNVCDQRCKDRQDIDNAVC